MTETPTQLLELVYYSANRIQGTEGEVNRELERILTWSRVNNAALSITGALIYNEGKFAQALEGPFDHVLSLFEKIQKDFRHSEIAVVENRIVSGRRFADWSMAFSTPSSPTERERALAAFNAAFLGEPNAGEQMLTLLRDLVRDQN